MLLRRLRTPGTGIAVPHLVDATGSLIGSIRREPTIMGTLAEAILGRRAGRRGLPGEVVNDPEQYRYEHRIDWAEGSTQLISAQCWQACGPWDESFFLYSEETEFNLRARDGGFHTVFVPEAGAVHLEGGSGSSDDLWALQVVNRVRLYGRRHTRLAAWLFWAANLMREGLRAVLGKSRSRAAVKALFNPGRFLRRTVPGQSGKEM